MPAVYIQMDCTPAVNINGLYTGGFQLVCVGGPLLNFKKFMVSQILVIVLLGFVKRKKYIIRTVV
jgi:hypothetical protein